MANPHQAERAEKLELDALRALFGSAVAFIFGEHTAEQAEWWERDEGEWQVWRRGELLHTFPGESAKAKAVAMAQRLHAEASALNGQAAQ